MFYAFGQIIRWWVDIFEVILNTHVPMNESMTLQLSFNNLVMIFFFISFFMYVVNWLGNRDKK